MNSASNNVPFFMGNRRSGSDQQEVQLPNGRFTASHQPPYHIREHSETSLGGTEGYLHSADNNVSFVPRYGRSSSGSFVHVPNSNAWNRPARTTQPRHHIREYSETSLGGTEGDLHSADNNVSFVPRYRRSSSGSFVHVPNSNAWNRPARTTQPRPDRPIVRHKWK
ncbi:hypothetical protein Syun_008922 [Stephania yunnanensis]|uniref:Uncharacterized protein n=1 Tax=Stephania yunnanensis TaxID=152371 RepID=A0AAP0KDJ0_9MAGN